MNKENEIGKADTLNSTNAWLLECDSETHIADFILITRGPKVEFGNIKEGDFLVLQSEDTEERKVFAFTRIHRKRTVSEGTMFCFDGVVKVDPIKISEDLNKNSDQNKEVFLRLDWQIFEKLLNISKNSAG